MGKFYGAIGFAEQKETSPGIWEEVITPRMYSGDLIRNTRGLETSDKINDNIRIANEISIVSDPYADQNFYSMRYIAFRGAKWKISNVEVNYPRLILTIGGLYNEQQTGTSNAS